MLHFISQNPHISPDMQTYFLFMSIVAAIVIVMAWIDAHPKTEQLLPSIIQVNTQNYDREVLASRLPVYINYYRSSPTLFDQQRALSAFVAGSYQGRVKFVQIDADTSPELARAAAVKGLRAHFILRPGVGVIAESHSFLNELNLMNFIDHALGFTRQGR